MEGVFHIVKAWLRGNQLMFQILPDPEDMILRGFLCTIIILLLWLLGGHTGIFTNTFLQLQFKS